MCLGQGRRRNQQMKYSWDSPKKLVLVFLLNPIQMWKRFFDSWTDNNILQVTMKASSRSEGTLPAQSSWRWIPIPDTTQITGGRAQSPLMKFDPSTLHHIFHDFNCCFGVCWTEEKEQQFIKKQNQNYNHRSKMVKGGQRLYQKLMTVCRRRWHLFLGRRGVLQQRCGEAALHRRFRQRCPVWHGTQGS